MKPSEEQALITLLGDEDERVQEMIAKKLLSLGDTCMPLLRRALASADEPAQRNARRILRQLCQADADNEFLDFCRSRDQDLERGAFLLARTGYPEVDMEPCRATLDAMAEALRGRLRGTDAAHTVVEKINRFLFREQKFRGNEADYYDPENSYLNRVLDRRLGIPITLSTVYLLIAARLHLPIVGVALPGHFLLKYRENDSEFFIDAFNEGLILENKDCREIVERMNQPFQPSFLAATGPRPMLARMCANLIHIYRERKETAAAGRMEMFLDALTD